TGRLLTMLNEPPPGTGLALPLLAGWLVTVAVPVAATAWPAWRAAGGPVVGLLQGADVVRTSRFSLRGGGLAALGARLVGARRAGGATAGRRPAPASCAAGRSRGGAGGGAGTFARLHARDRTPVGRRAAPASRGCGQLARSRRTRRLRFGIRAAGSRTGGAVTDRSATGAWSEPNLR